MSSRVLLGIIGFSLIAGILLGVAVPRSKGVHRPLLLGPAVTISEDPRVPSERCDVIDYPGTEVRYRGFPLVAYEQENDPLGCLTPKNPTNIYPLAILLLTTTTGLLAAATYGIYRKLNKEKNNG